MFKVGEGNDRLLNNIISKCIDENRSSKLMSPKDLDESTKVGELIHITWTSTIFGFLDDMYIMTEVDETDSDYRVVNI